MNGYIFITAHHHFDAADTQRYSAEKLLREKQLQAERVLSRRDRVAICRVHNAILVLREIRVPLTPERIAAVLRTTAAAGAVRPKDMLGAAARAAVADRQKRGLLG